MLDELSKLDRALMVFKALSAGLELNSNGYVWKFAVTDDDKVRLCTVGKDQNGNDVFMDTGSTLSGFIEWAGQVEDDQLLLLDINVVLNTIGATEMRAS